MRTFFAKTKAFFKRIYRILDAATRGFINDNCYTKASTLTFYTVQSIIPFLAFLLGIAKGFGFENYLENVIQETFSEQEEVFKYAIQISYSMLKHIEGGVIAGIGVLFLIWTNINLFGYIEGTLNEIWKVKTSRPFFRKLSDYFTTLIICPIILIASISLTLYIKAKYEILSHGYPILDILHPFIIFLFKLAPFVLIWIVFFFLYYLMPNTRPRIWPRVIAAIVAGSLFQLWQLIYINLQIKLFSYNVVYGTFAALPLFLIWLQFSWLIALAGAEIAAYIENTQFIKEGKLSGKFKKIRRSELGILIMYECVRNFYLGKKPITDEELSQNLRIPLDAIHDLLDILTKNQLLVPFEQDDGRIRYFLVSDPNVYTIKKVSEIIDHTEDYEIPTDCNKALETISKLLERIHKVANDSDANIGIKDLLDQVKETG